MLLEQAEVGAYQDSWMLHQALDEDGSLHQVTNLDVLYAGVIAPLSDIAAEGRKGGIRRMIARSRFRQSTEDMITGITSDDFESFTDESGPEVCMDGEQIHWCLWHDGDGVDYVEITKGDECSVDLLVQYLLASQCTLIVYAECCSGWLFVLRSEFTAFGTPDDAMSSHYGFCKVVIQNTGDDHTEGLSLSPDMLASASALEAEYGE